MLSDQLGIRENCMCYEDAAWKDELFAGKQEEKSME